MIGQILSFVKGLFNEVEIDIQVNIIPFNTPAADVSLAVVVEITENEYVWSDFFNRAIPVSALQFSHADSNGISGYRVSGTNAVVWRDQLSPVSFVMAEAA